jgi:glucose/arabinose dehydrogenase
LTPAPVVLQPDLQITNIGTASDGPPAQMDFGPDGRLYMTLANSSGPSAASVESFAYSPSGGLSDERTEVSTGGALGIGFGPVSLGVYGQPGVQTVTGMYLTDTARTINGNDVSNLRVLTQDQNGVWGGPNGGTDTIIVQNIPAGWHQADQIIIKQNADGTSTLYVGIGVRTKDGALAYPNPGNARDMAYGGTISEILDLKQVNGLVTDSAGFGLTGVATSNSDPDYSNAGPYTSTAVNKLIIQSSGARNPFGLALDGSGNLWFTNNFNRSQSDGTFNGTIDPSTGLLYGITTGDPAPGPDLANNAYDQFFEDAPLADYGYNNSNWRNDAADDNPSVTSEAAVNAGFFNFAEHGVRSTTFDNLVAPPGGFAEYNESNINQIRGLGPSASADGVAFYTGTTFPATYQGDAFIARYNSTVSDSTGHSITYNDLVTVDPTTGNVRIIANNFDNPLAVLYDGSGNMIIADYGDSAIYRLSSTPTPTPTVSDAGFEQPNAGPGSFVYDPSGTAWSFTGPAGVSANGSGFTSGNPPAPEGVQVGFVQDTGVISQSVAGWAAGSYVITFDAAQRGNYISNQNFEVLVDGTVVSTFTPTGTSYQAYSTAAFTVGAGSHTITFEGLDSAGDDNTALIDAVAIS